MDPTPGDDEWAHVPKRKTKRSRLVPNPTPGPSQTLTPQEIERDFRLRQREWTTSPSRREVLALLSRLRPSPGWALRAALLLASGSFATDNSTNRRRSLTQLAVFLDVLAHVRAGDGGPSLSSGTGADVPVLAQEPLYTASDCAFLETHGVRVLPSPPMPVREGGGEGEAGPAVGRSPAPGAGSGALPSGEEGVSASPSGAARASLGAAGEFLGRDCFLFEPFMGMNDTQVRAVVDADPVLYVGTGAVPGRELGKKGGSSERAGGKNGRGTGEDREGEGEVERGRASLRRFVDARWNYRFPAFEAFPNALEGMFICVARGEDEGGGGCE